jgi:hypothetical protein
MHVVPEFVPWYGPTEPAAACAIDLLEHPEKLAAQRERLAGLVRRLHKPGASMNAARMAMELLGGGRRSRRVTCRSGAQGSMSVTGIEAGG